MIVVEELFLEYFRANVYISRDDYAAAHIIGLLFKINMAYCQCWTSTLQTLCNQNISFSAWPYFDRYYIQGDEFVKLWSLIFPIINLYFPLEHKRFQDS